MRIFSGGSLTKIAYYSTIPHRRVLYEAERENAKSPTAEEVSKEYISVKLQQAYVL